MLDSLFNVKFIWMDWFDEVKFRAKIVFDYYKHLKQMGLYQNLLLCYN